MRGSDRGETLDRLPEGIPPAEPLDDRYFLPREEFIRLFADLPPLDYEEFRRDIDAYVDSDPTPRDWPEP